MTNSKHALVWEQAEGSVDYPTAIELMESYVAQIQENQAPEKIWLLEHPPLYTAGSSANPKDLLATPFPVYPTGRGGQYTYHGPGQRVAYVMVDLTKRQKDVRAYVCALEQWIIDTLAAVGVQGERRPGRIGIWVDSHGREEKIAAIGVRISRWVTYHGIAINVSPDLAHYQGIVPCGISEFGVTSLSKLGVTLSMDELDGHLHEAWRKNRFLSPALLT